MKKIISIILIFIVLLQINTKPIKSFSNTNPSLGIKYTIWDDDYEEKTLTTQVIYYGISFIVVGSISYLLMSQIQKHMGDTKPIENQPSIINSIEDVAIEKVYTYLSNENVSSLKEKLYLKFVDYKNSYMKFEFEKLKSICETNFFNNTVNQLNGLIANNYVNISHTFISKKIKIGNIYEEGNLIVIDLYLLVNYYDYIEDKDGNVIAGRKIEPVDNNLKIEFIITKNKDNITCSKCGKKVFLEKEGPCPYCQELVKIEAKDYIIRNISKC